MATPVQLELDFGPYVLDEQPEYEYIPLKGADCIGGHAIRHTSDEYRCRTCGHVWGIDEPRPPCDYDLS